MRTLKISIVLILALATLFASAQEKVPDTAKAAEPAKKCDQACFDECTKDKPLSECGVKCNCTEKADALTVQLTKNERCYGQCRQACTLKMFTNPVDYKDAGKKDKKEKTEGDDCFGSCTCICNKGCTDSCAKSAMKNFCLQSCGCPKNQTVTEDLLKKSDEYFKLPLDPRSNDELAADFQHKLTETVNEAFNKTESTEVKKVEKADDKKVEEPKVEETKVEEKKVEEKKVDPKEVLQLHKKEVIEKKKQEAKLNSKLEKIEKKWNDYVENANKLGVDPLVFCNQTCSHDCFLEANASTYDILTGCLINKCHCFQPDLPEASEKISFEALIALKNIILSEEERPGLEQATTAKSTGVGKIPTQMAVETEEEEYPTSEEDREEAREEAHEAKHEAREEAEEAEKSAEEAEQEVDEKAHEAKEKAEEHYKKAKEAARAKHEEAKEAAKEEYHKVKQDSDYDKTAKETGEKAKSWGKNAGEKVKDAAVDAKDKVAEIAEAGKQKVKEIADSFKGDPKEKRKTEVPPTGQPPLEHDEGAVKSGDVVANNTLAGNTTQTEECNLKCFRECLDLKKFVPYPVIQQCIEVRCHCTLDKTAQKLNELIQLNSLDTLGSSELNAQKPSVFFNFMLTLFILTLMGGAVYLLFKHILEKTKGKRFYSDSEMEYAPEPGYERIF